MSGLVNGLQNRVHPFESGRHLKFPSYLFYKVPVENAGLCLLRCPCVRFCYVNIAKTCR